MATTTVGNVIFQISADIKDIQGQVRGLENSFNTSFGRIQHMAGNLSGALSSAFGISLGVGGVTAAAAGLLNLAKSAAQYADEIGKASQRTGTSTEFISAWKHGADLAGVSFDELTTGLDRFNRTVVDAGRGTETARRPFDALKISLRDNTGALKTNEQLITEVAEAFQRMPDGVVKSALAQELLGRSGARLIALLNGGADGIKKFTDEAKRMGLTVTNEAAKAAEEFNDNMTRLGKSVEGLKIKIGNDLIPVAIRLLDIFARLGSVQLEGMETRALESSIAQIDKGIRIAEERLSRLTRQRPTDDAGRAFYDSQEGERQKLRMQLEGLRRDRADFDEQLQRLKADLSKPKPGGEFSLGDEKLKRDLEQVAEAIGAENVKLEEQLIKLMRGEEAAKDWALAQQEAREAAKGVTSDILQEQDRRRELVNQIREQTAAYETLKRLVEGTRKLPIEEEITFGLTPDQSREALEAWDKMLTERQAKAEQAIKDLGQLEQLLTLELTDESLRRVELINREHDARIASINRWRDEATAAFEAGTMSAQEYLSTLERLEQAQIDAGEIAAKKMKAEMTTVTDSITQAAQSSIETLGGLVNGTLKTAEDFGRAALRIVLQLIAQLIQAQALFSLTGGRQGSNVFGGLLGSLVGSFFGGGGNQFTGGATGYEAGFFHRGGLVPAYHTGGMIGLRRFHGGGDVPILAQSGEYVVKQSSVRNIGVGNLNYMNQSGRLPGQGGDGGDGVNVKVEVNGDITPRRPEMRKEEVVKVVVQSMKDKGVVYNGMIEYGPKR